MCPTGRPNCMSLASPSLWVLQLLKFSKMLHFTAPLPEQVNTFQFLPCQYNMLKWILQHQDQERWESKVQLSHDFSVHCASWRTQVIWRASFSVQEYFQKRSSRWRCCKKNTTVGTLASATRTQEIAFYTLGWVIGNICYIYFTTKIT